MSSDYPFDIFKLLTIILSFLLLLLLLITSLISSNLWPLYCLSFFDYGFWLPLWYLQTFDHYIVFPSLIMASDYPLISSNLWPLYCLSFFYYGFWLPLWYLQYNGQMFEDIKGVVRSHNRRREDNIMVKSLKISKG
jgi:hypothetical protein